jgi:NAD(P) transhydrogenase
MDLDLLVIGSGPSGQKAAIQAAKLGKRVAVVERKQRLGGVSIHTGTIPSKTLRVAVLGRARPAPARHPRPAQPEGRERAAIEFLMDRAARVVGAEAQVVREQFRRNRVGLLFGNGQFVDEHTISITDEDQTKEVTAGNIIVAVGTYPARPADVQFDDEHVIDSDGLLNLHQRLPRSMTVVGAGVIGVEYASMFGRLGTKVTVVDQRPRVLTFLDGEIGEALQFILRRNNVTFRLQEKVASVGTDKTSGDVITRLASGKEIHSETVLYATGRQGATDTLDLKKIGIEPNKRGYIEVDGDYRTKVPHVFAVGDCSGGFGLAATAMEQGRLAALHAFKRPVSSMPELLPTGVYAIPEIAMVGRTEEDLTEAGVPYVSGIARWSELARGLMTGDEDGMLKLLVSTEDRSLLGVHVLGTARPTSSTSARR